MKYLIDTDWLIDHLSGVKKVKTKLEELAPEGLAISIISLAEIYELRSPKMQNILNTVIVMRSHTSKCFRVPSH